MECTKKTNVLVEAGLFASHGMLECIVFAKANQGQTLFWKPQCGIKEKQMFQNKMRQKVEEDLTQNVTFKINT